jgi:O-antigen/teichoic acid export membrane protein/chemotaxis methyl-accepting protein methylase
MEKPSAGNAFARPSVDQLKRKSLRGGVVAIGAQGAKLICQTATTMLLARLLTAEDFGLLGMAATLISFVGLFGVAGLSTATIQRLEVTEEQISTLFWINTAVGFALSVLTVALAPVVVSFYGDQRLYWITIVSGISFVFGGLAAQHQALVLRDMRFVTQAKIDLLSLAISSTLAVAMAWYGWHYWALVAMGVAGSLISAVGVWLATRWIPGLPQRNSGVRSMLHFGSLTTLNSVLVFLAWNCDNILLGRFWGADSLGLYGRAFQLATLPVNQLNSAVHGVAFSALSRIQDDADRLARSFLRGYSILLSLTIPVTITYPLFAEEIVQIILGSKWSGAAPILRLLAPTALVFAIANPFSLLIMSVGRAGRALTLSAMVTPPVIVGVVLGLSYGPQGVALGEATAMTLMIIPIIAWSIKGTKITWADLWNATRQPVLAGLLAGAVGLIVKLALGGVLAPIALLAVGLSLVFGVYAWVLLVAMGQKDLYVELMTEVRNRSAPHAIRDERGAARSHPMRGATFLFAMPSADVSRSVLARMSRSRILRKYLGRPYRLLTIWAWNQLPAKLASWPAVRIYGRHVHGLVQLAAARTQYVGTYFFRNRPELELLVRLLEQKSSGSTLDLTILACSKGAEVYSFAYAIRSARPDLKLNLRALDISKDVLEFAEAGIYSLDDWDGAEDSSAVAPLVDGDVAANTARQQPTSIFERMSVAETEKLFDREGRLVKVKPRYREGITWHLGDANDPGLVGTFGPQDIVVANRFLCHMHPAEAEACLRNIATLVKPNGYLFVSGVDLSVRSKVARELGWAPVTELLREIHDGDPSLRRDWPLHYWGLEPLDRNRSDWKMRYASVFQLVRQ